jgi:hypothetical protein
MSEVEPKRNLTPQEVIANAFIYFNAQQRGMDEESLIRVCLAANCPNRETARRVLVNMVKTGELTAETSGSQTVYKLGK